QLGLVLRTAARLHQRMALDALLRRGRGREAQVQVALLGGEFAQRAHGDGIAHGPLPGALRHCTWQTLTGMPCARQYCSQRIWLSWSLSPGPLTSTSS